VTIGERNLGKKWLMWQRNHMELNQCPVPSFSTGVELKLARQELYHLSHTLSLEMLFCV
jgi:hypothetical protein